MNNKKVAMNVFVALETQLRDSKKGEGSTPHGN